jgi:hypothetical protein
MTRAMRGSASKPDEHLESVVTNDVYGPEGRAKDVSPRDQHEAGAGCARVEPKLSVCGRRSPPQISSGHPLSSARRHQGWRPRVAGPLRVRPSEIRIPRGFRTLTTHRTDQGLRSSDIPRRRAPSRRPGCLRPLRPESANGLLRPDARQSRPPAHAARMTLANQWDAW